MRVYQGQSAKGDAAISVAEATDGWPPAPDMVFAFTSTDREPAGVAQALKERFPSATFIGSSSAGEYVGGERLSGSLAVAGVYDSPITWATRNIPGVAQLSDEQAQLHVAHLFETLGVHRETFIPDEYFALLLVDGMSMSEERLCASLADALSGIPLVGGSAGDDLKFRATTVFSDKGTLAGGAILVLARRGSAEVQVFKHQHFDCTDRLLCVTRADAGTRTVYELDGLPAAYAYAQALGMRVDELTNDTIAAHPLSLMYDGEVYIRSIRSVNFDASLTFYCGIELGLVLDVATRGNLAQALEQSLLGLASPETVDLLLGFNCVLRALEAERTGADARVQQCFRKVSRAMIGFATYGEQLNGLHINHSLVALALRDTRKRVSQPVGP